LRCDIDSRAPVTSKTVDMQRDRLLAALHSVALAIRDYHEAGNPMNMRTALAIVAIVFDSIGRNESAPASAHFVNRSGAVAR
jgi:hypothetical protein